MSVVVVISQHLLNVFVQLANKRGLKKNMSEIKHKYFASIATKYSLAYNYIFVSLHVSANGGQPQVNTIQHTV
jgi:uncharacterized membrane protein YqhA